MATDGNEPASPWTDEIERRAADASTWETPTWCPQCGPGVRCDDDGTCALCGADAVGPGALMAFAAVMELQRSRVGVAQMRSDLYIERHDRKQYLEAFDAAHAEAAALREQVEGLERELYSANARLACRVEVSDVNARIAAAVAEERTARADLLLLAWAQNIAMGDLMMRLSEQADGNACDALDPEWRATLSAHEAFLGWAIRHDDSTIPDETIADAVKRWNCARGTTPETAAPGHDGSRRGR